MNGDGGSDYNLEESSSFMEESGDGVDDDDTSNSITLSSSDTSFPSSSLDLKENIY